MDRLLLSLAIFLISTSAVQAQLVCFTDSDCATPVVGGTSSNAEDCCVNNDAGMSYTTSDGGQCFQCIVYGFGSDTFTRPEAQFPYNVPFAYFKGPSNAQLRMAIDYNGEGTASEDEFGIGQSVVSLPLNPGGTTSITFQADRVALEQDETFVLELALLNVANANRALFDSSLPNVFFRSRQEFIIQDSTALVFRLRESDRVVDEGDRFIPVEVTVANEVELASDISLVLTPMIATEDFRPLPTTRPFARANTNEGRIDFFTTPITLNFTAGGEILLAGDVLIFDDMIDEALEYFVVTLTFQDPDNVPPLASIEINGGDIIRIDIVDNDDIFIGFALSNTTYPEEERDYRIQIIKGEGNITEQTISFVVNLFQNAPPGLGAATPSTDTEDNDFSFPSSTLESIGPEENDVFVDVTIFADELPEVREAAQLRLSLPTDGMFPGFETLPQYPDFFIIIDDDDRFRIGFENTSYTVNEGIGMLEVCVRMFEPPENTPLGTLTVSIGVETVQGSADGDDYTEVTGARFAHFLFFSDTSRRSCFMVEITEDNRYEFEEQFSLQFIELEGTSLPDNLVLDPAGSNITIVDDTEVTVGFINPPYSAREDEGPMIFTVGVTSDHILNRDIELSFSTVDGLIANFAAMAGLDYTSIINMPIILSAGMQTINISVDLNPDQLFENSETFQGILTIISGERVSLSPGTADATIIDGEEVTVGFINPPYSAGEDEGPIIFTVGVTSGHTLNRDIELSFSTADGLIADFAAMAGLDYTSIINMPIILNAGMQSIDIAVDLNPDQLFENNEMFQGILNLLTTESVSLSPGTADATIIDGEEVTVGFINLPYSAREDEGPMIFTVGVTSGHTLNRDIELSFSTADGLIADFAAMAGLDYTSIINMSFILSAGMQSINISVDLNPDQLYENNEMFQGILSLVTTDRVSLSPGTADATIIDGGEVTVGFINPPYSAREDEGPIIFTVGVTSGHTLNRDIELSFSTADGLIADFAAMAGLDYTSIINMPIILSAGMQSINIPVVLNNDPIFENNEMFQGMLTIISGEGVSLSPGTADATIIEDDVVCQELELLVNGSIEYSPDTTAPYLEGTNAQHICFPGFVLIGNVIRVCQNDSTFSGTPPTCQPIQCNPLDEIENGVITYAPDVTPNYDLGTVAFYACNAGFVLDISLGSTFRMCVDDDGLDAIGVFDNQAPRCVPIECPVLPVFANGMIVYATDVTPNFDLGTTATYSCNEGYTLDISIGVEVRTCIDDGDNDAVGVFSDQAPACVRIQCTPLSGIPNGMIEYGPDTTANYMLGTNATYICNDGFFLDLSVGNEIRTCEDDDGLDDVGEFTGSQPTCVRIECLPLDPITNGIITYAIDTIPNYDLGTVATYDCDAGYFLDLSQGGSMTRTCFDDLDNDAEGLFSGQAPACIPIECPPLPTFTNGMISYSPDISPNFDLGTDATYTCDAGFFLDVNAASQVRTCIDDNGMDAIGVWSGQEPSCIPVECSPLTNIANGVITYAPDTTSNYDLGTVATYDCNAGFVLDLSLGGSVTRTCFDDLDNDAEGVFSGQAPACIPIECLLLPTFTNGIISYSPDISPNFALGTDATYTCDAGFFLDVTAASQVRTCIDDNGMDAIGVWSGQEPSCIPVECSPLTTIANGFITYAPDTTSNYDLGTVATYDCDAGFVLDLSLGGSVTRTCFDDLDNDAQGVFSGQEPRCISIECLPLGQVTNGMITYAPDTTSNYDLGTVATYTCNDGFRLDITQGGSETRTCIDDLNGDAVGVFTNLPPRCVLINVVRVNDTVIGDPLMTVPLYVQNKSAIMPLGEDDLIHLCFEVHGSSDAYFNLVSDDCVSVNAHYQQIAAGEDINIVDDISVRAVDSNGSCHNIEVLLDQCTATVDGVVINDMYSMNDIMVRKYPSRVRIAVPNCGSTRGLVMWVMCQTQTFWSTNRTNADGTEFTFQGEAIRFVVARGLNLREESHGILGQFWNIPIQVVPYNGPFTEPQVEDDVATFSVIINSPGDLPRQFIAWLRFPSWEYERRMYCLYAGDGHAGSVYEVPAGPANGPVIEGVYTDYIVSGQFETDFAYNQFDSNMCL